MKLYLILLMTFFAFGCGFSFNQASFYLPSDREMQNNFLKNEIEFNKLVEMLIEEDSSISFISKEKKKLYFTEGKISDERWNEYQSLFEKANILNSMKRYENFNGQNPVTFLISGEDLSGQTNKDPYDEFFTGDKGYAYSAAELAPLVDSLDNISDKQLRENRYFFKKIKDNWYLYYQIGVRKPE